MAAPSNCVELSYQSNAAVQTAFFSERKSLPSLLFLSLQDLTLTSDWTISLSLLALADIECQTVREINKRH